MPPRTTYSFKPTPIMQQHIQDVMQHWEIDRTSVVKLALYMFSAYAVQSEVRQQSRAALVGSMEQRVPKGFPSFGEFAD